MFYKIIKWWRTFKNITPGSALFGLGSCGLLLPWYMFLNTLLRALDDDLFFPTPSILLIIRVIILNGRTQGITTWKRRCCSMQLLRIPNFTYYKRALRATWSKLQMLPETTCHRVRWNLKQVAAVLEGNTWTWSEFHIDYFMTVNDICPNFEVVARSSYTKHVRNPPEYINSHIQMSTFIVQQCRLSTLL